VPGSQANEKFFRCRKTEVRCLTRKQSRIAGPRVFAEFSEWLRSAPESLIWRRIRLSPSKMMLAPLWRNQTAK
jgi:hypothetical protein